MPDPGSDIGEPPVMQSTGGGRPAWTTARLYGLAAYLLSRGFIVAGAAAVSVQRAIDPADPTAPRPGTATKGILDVLNSWDGLWYYEIIRHGYPRQVPPDVTFGMTEARAAFFPVYPFLARALDRVLPGGDVPAALLLNFVLGGVFVYLVGMLARRLFDDDVARRAMVFTAMFPGSFVLLFAYSEASLVVLSAACLWFLHHRNWLLAGVAAALATAARPNGVAAAAACGVAALFAIRERREWRSLIAPALSPLGLIAFHLLLSRQAGERMVWFRVQREAWDEGLSFGWSAVQKIGTALHSPLSSPTSMFTLGSVVAMLWMVWALWKVRLPAPMVAYTVVVLALMLLPSTVTARPRFLFTAFPLFIAFAAWWPKKWADEWAFVLAACGAGLVAVTAVYGAFGAIP